MNQNQESKSYEPCKESSDGVKSEETLCSYQYRHCLSYPLSGYIYCIQHILEDKSAPYKQCSYVHHKSGRRCPNATLKSDKYKECYCQEHVRKLSAARRQAQKSNKRKAPDTIDSIMSELDQSVVSSQNKLTTGVVSSKSLIPISLTSLNKTSSTDYQTDSDSDKEPLLLEDLFRGDNDSDADSNGSDQEDPLRYAGVYTAEEVALMMRDKLIRLQSLYIDQFKRLQHVLRERRRKYLRAVKKEKELYGSIAESVKNAADAKTYDKLRVLNRFHCKRGKEALLQQQNKEKRLAVTEGASYKPQSSSRCIHVDDSIRCTTSPLPYSKYCLKHILNDPHQVLFKPCKYADSGCNKVIVPYQDDTRCVLHASLSESVEPLVKTLPQGSGVSPRGYNSMISDLDKFLGDPDQFLSSLSSAYTPNSGDVAFSTEQMSSSEKSTVTTEIISSEPNFSNPLTSVTQQHHLTSSTTVTNTINRPKACPDRGDVTFNTSVKSTAEEPKSFVASVLQQVPITVTSISSEKVSAVNQDVANGTEIVDQASTDQEMLSASSELQKEANLVTHSNTTSEDNSDSTFKTDENLLQISDPTTS